MATDLQVAENLYVLSALSDLICGKSFESQPLFSFLPGF
jgi:hypothetical protein